MPPGSCGGAHHLVAVLTAPTAIDAYGAHWAPFGAISLFPAALPNRYQDIHTRRQAADLTCLDAARPHRGARYQQLANLRRQPSPHASAPSTKNDDCATPTGMRRGGESVMRIAASS